MSLGAGAGGGHLLAADVGGTKTAIALAAAGTPPRILAQDIFQSQRYRRLEDIIAEFLDGARAAVPGLSIVGACFAVAGPVSGNSATLTNLGWQVESEAVAREFGLGTVRFINDFAAAGRGIEHLGPADIETLQSGRPRARGVRLIIGAGTGLGTGVMTWHDSGYAVHPSEAGHADFAPVDETQDRLLDHLRRAFGRVSYERVVSGPGLMRIFSFLQETGAGMPSKDLLEAATRKEADTASLIAEFAGARLDPLAVRALDIFVTAYGAYAGNMALAVLPHGGVFLAGGIAPKILPKLKEGAFMRAFTDKGRFSGLLADIPVHVIMNPHLGLYGAILEANSLRR
jgi:glucokinase